MRKSQIEKLRKTVWQKSAGTGANRSGGIAQTAREAAPTASEETEANGSPRGRLEADRRLLARFYAARLAGRDYDRSLAPTAQRLASMAFDEAVAALIVWKREIAKMSAALDGEEARA